MSDLKVYEVTRSYMTVELHHVKAKSEREAVEQFALCEKTFIRSDDEDINSIEAQSIEGPWDSVEEYEEEYGAFE